MLIFHTDHNILMALLGEEESSAAEHIKNGYPELLEDWNAGRIRATKLDKFVPMKCLVMDGGKPRPMTDDEIKARDAALAAEASEKAAAAEAVRKALEARKGLIVEGIAATGEAAKGILREVYKATPAGAGLAAVEVLLEAGGEQVPATVTEPFLTLPSSAGGGTGN